MLKDVKDTDVLSNADALALRLKLARTDANTQGNDRVTQLGAVLDAICGKHVKWSRVHCTKCLYQIYKEYAANQAELLKASTGPVEESSKRTASERRAEYKAQFREKVEVRTLERRENTALEKAAQKMVDENKKGGKLTHILQSALSHTELIELGLEELAGSQVVPSEESVTTVQKYLRNGKISNIGPTDGLLTGGESLLADIEACFKSGYSVQFIGGYGGVGKSRLVFEYAARHKDDYRIICWVDAWDEDHLVSSILQFFYPLGISSASVDHSDVAESFHQFFSVNTNWLIIFDNADMTATVRKDMLKKYLPSGDGHILVSCNYNGVTGDDFKKSIMHWVDGFQLNKKDGRLLFEKLVSHAPRDRVDTIVDLCNGNPLCLTLVASLIRPSSWITPDIYIKMLQDCNVTLAAKDRPTIEVALDLLFSMVKTKERFDDSPVWDAVEEALATMFLFGKFSSVDFEFLTSSFPILPDIIVDVYKNADYREQFRYLLRGFGILEIREGVFLTSLSYAFVYRKLFSDLMLYELCKKILQKIEETVSAVLDNRFIPQDKKDIFLAQAKPYINDAVSSMWSNRLKSRVLLGEINDVFPNAARLSYLLGKTDK